METFDTNSVIPVDDTTIPATEPPPPLTFFGIPAGVAATILLLLASAAWGFSYSWMNILMEALGEALRKTDITGSFNGSVKNTATAYPAVPLLAAAWRFGVTAFLWALFFPRSVRGWTRRTWRAGAITGTTFAAGVFFQFYGLARTTPVINAFIVSLFILFVPLIETAWFRRRPSFTLIAGCFTAFAGIILITLPDGFNGLKNITGIFSGFGIGELLTVGASLCYSFTIILLNHYLSPTDEKIPAENPWRLGLATMVAVTIAGFFGSWMLAGGSVFFNPFFHFHYLGNSDFSVNMALSAVFAGLMAFALQFRYQPLMSPTRASMIYSTEPVFAAVYAWIVLNKPMGYCQLVGSALILTANMAVIFQKKSGKTTLGAVEPKKIVETTPSDSS